MRFLDARTYDEACERRNKYSPRIKGIFATYLPSYVRKVCTKISGFTDHTCAILN